MNHTPNPVGRRPQTILYIDVHYNQKDYVVGFLVANTEEIAFVFDKDMHETILSRTWHRASNTYISSGIMIDGKKKELYMHNLVMGRMEYNGKGQTETVSHINRIGFDNRKENLKIDTQSNQNIHQKQRTRNIVLPEGCGVQANEIPRHISYNKTSDTRGDSFTVDLTTLHISWKSTSSKHISTREKLNMAIEKLKELYLQYPHLDPQSENTCLEMESLRTSFDEIVAAARSKRSSM